MSKIVIFLAFLLPMQSSPTFITQGLHVSSSCSATVGSDCVDNAVWSVPFDNTSYKVSCTGINPHVAPVMVGVESKSAGGFRIRMSARQVAGSPSYFDGYDCIGIGSSGACTDPSQGCGVHIVPGL